jgi:hypothetical protein
MDIENIDFKTATEKVNSELENIDGTINNLLDNLTSENREFVDIRLKQLKGQKIKLESRLEELQSWHAPLKLYQIK